MCLVRHSHRNTIQRTATPCDVPQPNTTHCNTVQRTATPNNALQHPAMYRSAMCKVGHSRHNTLNTLQHAAPLCNTRQHHLPIQIFALQHTAKHCNVLQHTAAPCAKSEIRATTRPPSRTRFRVSYSPGPCISHFKHVHVYAEVRTHICRCEEHIYIGVLCSVLQAL